MYKNGEGVKQDKLEAAYWWKLAADQGHAKAQGILGLAYIIGEGVKKDYSKGIYLLKRSARQGDKDARKALIGLGEDW